MQADQKRELNKQLESSHGSFELVVSPVVLALIGWWLDAKLGTTPWLIVAFAIAGFGGAVVSLYFRYQAKMETMNAERASHSLMNAGAAARSERANLTPGNIAEGSRS